MRSLFRGFSFLAFLTLSMSLVSAQSATKGERVFIAGHSFLMPIVGPLGQIAKVAGLDEHKLAGVQSIGGSTTKQHWDREDSKNVAKQTIQAKSVDVLVLSPHSRLMPDPAIDQFVELLLANNPNGRVTLQASWLLSDGQPKGFTEASRDTADIPALRKIWNVYYDQLRDQAKKINDVHRAKAKRDVVFVVPAGEALLRLRERIAKGEVPGIAKQSQLYRDLAGHGGAEMAVLTAYCTYAVLYGKSPVGLAVPDALKAGKLGDNAEKVNRILQECAWEAVLAEPASGVKEAK